jgi:hypothetical protein
VVIAHPKATFEENLQPTFHSPESSARGIYGDFEGPVARIGNFLSYNSQQP